MALALALAGGSADADLTAICDTTAVEVVDGLDELERARLVHPVAERWELAYPNMADAVLRNATSAERRGMHGRIAARLDGRRAAGIGLVELAHHLEEAGPSHAASLVAVAPLAAQEAFAAGAWGQAAHLYEIALREVGDDNRQRAAELEERPGSPTSATSTRSPACATWPGPSSSHGPKATRCWRHEPKRGTSAAGSPPALRRSPSRSTSAP